MTNPAYTQTRCPRCGAGAWALPTHAVPCQSCGTPVGPMGAMPGTGTPSYQAQGYQGQQGYGAQAPAAAPAYNAQGYNGQGYNGQGHNEQGHNGQGHNGQGYGQGYNGQGHHGQGYGAQAPAAAPAFQAPAQFAYGTGAPVQGTTPAAAAPPVAPAVGGHNFAVNVGGFKIPFKVGGGVSRFKIFGTIGLVIALAVGGMIVKMKLGTTAKGNLSYAGLGVDHKKPDADKLIAALANPARKWKRDAAWWSANFQSVDAEGRIDVSKGAAVEYVSPSGVQSHAKSVRKDSIKKYSAGMAGVSHNRMWGATNVWENVEMPPVPTCKVKDVMAIVGKTLPAGKTVRVTFDSQFADFYAWRVMSDDPKIDTLYAFSDCTVIK